MICRLCEKYVSLHSFAITPPDMVDSFYSNSEGVYEVATLHVLSGCIYYKGFCDGAEPCVESGKVRHMWLMKKGLPQRM